MNNDLNTAHNINVTYVKYIFQFIAVVFDRLLNECLFRLFLQICLWDWRYLRVARLPHPAVQSAGRNVGETKRDAALKQTSHHQTTRLGPLTLTLTGKPHPAVTPGSINLTAPAVQQLFNEFFFFFLIKSLVFFSSIHLQSEISYISQNSFRWGDSCCLHCWLCVQEERVTVKVFHSQLTNTNCFLKKK